MRDSYDRERDRDRDRDRDNNHGHDRDSEENRPPDENGWLAELLGVLERVARSAADADPDGDPDSEPVDRHGESDDRRDRRLIDYDVSVRTGIAESRRGRGHDRDRDPDHGQDPDHESGPNVGADADIHIGVDGNAETDDPSSQDHRITTRRYGEEFFITADLPNVDVDAITVGLADTSLVLGIDGRELERISLPWEEVTATAAIHNDILTVTIGPEGDDQ